jgi:hypothetical protein
VFPTQQSPFSNPLKAALPPSLAPAADAADDSSSSTDTTNDATLSESAITTKEYDLRQLKSFSSNLLFEGAMSTFMHFKQKSMRSLVFALLVGISNLINNNVVKIHVLGESVNQSVYKLLCMYA